MFQLLQTLSTFELMCLIGSIIGGIWWLSSMYWETRTIRTTHEKGNEATEKHLTSLNTTFSEGMQEIRSDLKEVSGRVGTLEDWRIAEEARKEERRTQLARGELSAE